MTPLLAVRDLSVTYTTDAGRLTAAREVSFDLAAGEALESVCCSICRTNRDVISGQVISRPSRTSGWP